MGKDTKEEALDLLRKHKVLEHAEDFFQEVKTHSSQLTNESLKVAKKKAEKLLHVASETVSLLEKKGGKALKKVTKVMGKKAQDINEKAKKITKKIKKPIRKKVK